MFREESIWIKTALSKIAPNNGQNEVANIGSSTEHFRKVIQPHIHDNIIASLQQSGWQVFHVDIKKEPGVDLVADVTKADFYKPFSGKFGLTICTNLLEHVEDIQLVIENLARITVDGGYILLTVPYKYKLHYDPIDNGFRPTPAEIAQRFKDSSINCKTIDAKIVVIQDLEYYRIKKSKIPFWGYRERLNYYLGKRHKVSGILLQITHNANHI